MFYETNLKSKNKKKIKKMNELQEKLMALNDGLERGERMKIARNVGVTYKTVYNAFRVENESEITDLYVKIYNNARRIIKQRERRIQKSLAN